MKKTIAWGLVALLLLTLTGCPTDGDDDGKKDEGEDTQLKLTITGMPQDITILAASLFKDTMSLSDVVATGALVNGVFSFMVADPTTGWPTSALYSELGEYYILLATSTSGKNNYLYVGGGVAPVKFNFDSLTKTLAWENNFLPDGTSEAPPDVVLTVTGVPAGVVMVALLADIKDLGTLATGDFSVLSASGAKIVGGAFNINGMGEAKFDPFATEGYYLILVGQGAMAQTPSFEGSYIHFALQGEYAAPAQFVFDKEKSNTIAFTVATQSEPGSFATAKFLEITPELMEALMKM